MPAGQMTMARDLVGLTAGSRKCGHQYGHEAHPELATRQELLQPMLHPLLKGPGGGLKHTLGGWEAAQG